MNSDLPERFALSLEHRKAWEKACGAEPCPNCAHLKSAHCSRNRDDGSEGCCAGHCFEFDGDPGCPCPGWSVTK